MLNIKKIKPMFNSLVTTMDCYSDDVYKNGILQVKKGTIKEYQTVLFVGDGVRDIKVGDLVEINPTRYAKMKHEPGSLKDGIVSDNMVMRYEFDVKELDHKPCLFLYDNDIKCIIEEYEDEPECNTPIIMPSSEVAVS